MKEKEMIIYEWKKNLNKTMKTSKLFRLIYKFFKNKIIMKIIMKIKTKFKMEIIIIIQKPT